MPLPELKRRPAAALAVLVAAAALLARTLAQTAMPAAQDVAHPNPATSSAASAPPAPATGPMNRMVIVLDPAHGGVDGGSRLSENLVEKDVTLAFAFRLRSLLASRGFTVVMTRDSDAAMSPSSPAIPLSLDDRAGIANHQRPVACLLLHATSAGSGVHLYTSELSPAAGEETLLPWLTAQAAWVGQSGLLARQMATALDRSRILLVSSTASVRPVDSLTCPAVVLELAPNGDDPATINEAGYQQRVAEAIAGAMIFWKGQAQPPPRIVPVEAAKPPKPPAIPAAAEDTP